MYSYILLQSLHIHTYVIINTTVTLLVTVAGQNSSVTDDDVMASYRRVLLIGTY